MRELGINLTARHRAAIRRAIGARPITEVAASAGLAPRYLYHVLKGRARPSPAALAAICRAVGLPARVRTVVEIG